MMNDRRSAARSSRGLTGIFLRVLQFLAVSAGFFLWWMAMFLLLSLFAVNIWQVTFTEILIRSLVLTGLSAAAYLFIMFRREKKKQEDDA